MRRNSMLVALGLIGGLLISACGVGMQEGRNPIRSFPEGTTWPQVLEGAVSVQVEVGDVGDDGLCDLNFGALETDAGLYLISIPGDALRAAGISRSEVMPGGIRCRVTLGGPDEYVGAPTYAVSLIEKRP